MSQTLAKTKGYTLTVEAPKKLGLQHYDEAELAPNEVRLRTLYSGISAGTELTAYRGSNPYLTKHWDEEEKLFRSGTSSWTYPMPAIGYEEVGVINELGSAVEGLTIGDKVWGFWGHKSSHIGTDAWAKERLLPAELEPICGIFSRIGAIALNAILDADIHLGETVAVFGQGVPGLMVTQLAKASGAEVVAIDRLNSRLEEAKACGADHVINSTDIDAGTAVKDITGGRGADVSIEITGVYAALHDAIRSTAYNSKVIASGFFQGEGKGLFLGEEFHHNRIDVVCSQIFGVSRHLDHRWDTLRLDQTAIKLQAQGKVDFKRLISHTFSMQNAQEAFTLLDERPEEALQVVLEFGENA